jgi:nitrogen regulatory protein P-II 1
MVFRHEIKEMKKVVAIVRLEKMDALREALEKTGFPGMTVTPTSGQGREKGISLFRRGRQWKERFVPRVKFEVVVQDAELDRLIATILTEATTGRVGDGKIFVEPVEEAIRIRDGKRGEEAICGKEMSGVASKEN